MGIYNYLISIANLIEMERITFVGFQQAIIKNMKKVIEKSFEVANKKFEKISKPAVEMRKK